MRILLKKCPYEKSLETYLMILVSSKVDLFKKKSHIIDAFIYQMNQSDHHGNAKSKEIITVMRYLGILNSSSDRKFS